MWRSLQKVLVVAGALAFMGAIAAAVILLALVMYPEGR